MYTSDKEILRKRHHVDQLMDLLVKLKLIDFYFLRNTDTFVRKRF